MSDIDGVQNIPDDLNIHGKDYEEHDKNLYRVIWRLEKKGLTLNAE